MQRQNQNKPKLILGVTGSFASGKTTVAKMFASGGAKLLDADKIAHSVIKRGNIAYKRIIVLFGQDILDKTRQINRSKLAGIVFDNKKSLMKLNNIVHPQVIRAIRNKIRRYRSKFVVLDVPLLFEAGLRRMVDKVIVVKITKTKQIDRAKLKRSLSRADILKRVESQFSQNEKLRFADFIIDNSGTMKQTRRQVKNVWKSLATRIQYIGARDNFPTANSGKIRRKLWKN